MGSCRDVLLLKRSRRQPPHLPLHPREGLSLCFQHRPGDFSLVFCSYTVGTGKISHTNDCHYLPATSLVARRFEVLVSALQGFALNTEDLQVPNNLYISLLFYALGHLLVACALLSFVSSFRSSSVVQCIYNRFTSLKPFQGHF